MKRIGIAVGFVVLVFGVAILAQIQTESVEQELIRLEKEWYDAEVKKDAAFFDRIMADDFIGTGATGNVYTKAQDISSLESGEEVIASAVSDEFTVHVYGDAAVVAFRSTEKGQNKGKDYIWESRWTDTWIKKAGRWQCVASHCSTITQK
jgi:ketosteroid isomerase-like protein